MMKMPEISRPESILKTIRMTYSIPSFTLAPGNKKEIKGESLEKIKKDRCQFHLAC
jgi:hypothetical protein